MVNFKKGFKIGLGVATGLILGLLTYCFILSFFSDSIKCLSGK